MPPPDPQIYGAATAPIAALLCVNDWGPSNAYLWTTAGNAVSTCLSEWNTNNRDAAVARAIPLFDPSRVRSINMPQAEMLAYLRIYYPSMTAADVGGMCAFIDLNVDSVPAVLSAMQTQGMSTYFSQMADACFEI